MAHDFLLTLLSRDPTLVEHADRAGVDRIGIDIERLGKHARQADTADARISDHELDDLAGVASVVRRAEVFVRLNRWHDGTPAEVDRRLRRPGRDAPVLHPGAGGAGVRRRRGRAGHGHAAAGNGGGSRAAPRGGGRGGRV
jgi:hypothetical protein